MLKAVRAAGPKEIKTGSQAEKITLFTEAYYLYILSLVSGVVRPETFPLAILLDRIILFKKS
jgi:hypothetical protein